MKKLFAIICLLASAGIVLAQYKQNSVTTNSEVAMTAWVDSRVVSPTNGITAAVATNISAYQAQIATNALTKNRFTTNADNVSINGSTLTNLSATQLKSGTIDSARFPSTVELTNMVGSPYIGFYADNFGSPVYQKILLNPAGAGYFNFGTAGVVANYLAGDGPTITALTAGNISAGGTFLAINAAALTNINGTNIQALTVSNAVIANATISTNKMDAVAYAAFTAGGSGSASNAVARISTNGVTVLDGVTNLNFISGTSVTLSQTNGNQTVGLTINSTASGGLSESATNGWLSTTNVTDRYGTNTLTIGQGPQANLNSALHFVGGATPHMEFFGPTSYLYVNLPQTNADVVHLNGLLVVDPDNVVYGAGTLALPSATATSPSLGDDDTSVATTEWVRDSITNVGAINVKDYGATGDGSTDDTATIQAALDAVPARGGFVYVPRSATGYRVDGTLYPKYGTTFFGEGNKVANASQLNHSTGATPLISVTNEGVYIKNMKLLGSGPTTGSVGVAFTNSIGNWGVEDVQIELFDSGINIGSAWIGDILRTRIRACVAGISFSNTVNNVTVSGGSILLCSNAVAGSFTASSANKFINGLNIERSRFGGINVSNTAGNLEISGCYFEWNTNYGVRIVGVQSAYSRPIVEKNFFTDNSTTQTNIYLINAVGANVRGNSSTANAGSTFLAADSGSTNLLVEANSHTGTNVIANMGVPQTMFASDSQYAAGVGYTNAGFVGNFMGLIRSGDGTNAAGSRVAYLSDVAGGSQTNVTDSAAYGSTVNSNLLVKGTLTVYGASSFTDLTVTNFVIATNWDASLATNLNGTEIRSGTVADARIASTITRDTEWDTLAEIEAIILRTVTTNNATLTATTLMVGDGARGVAPTTTGAGVLTTLGIGTNTAGGIVTQNGPLGTPSSGSGANLTSIPISAIVAPSVIQTNGNSTAYSNNVSITAPAYYSTTNANNTGAYTAGLSYFTNLTGNITIAPFASIPSGSWSITIAAKADGTTRSITFPNGTVNNANGTAPGVAYVTNGTTLVMQVVGFGSSFTNLLSPH